MEEWTHVETEVHELIDDLQDITEGGEASPSGGGKGSAGQQAFDLLQEQLEEVQAMLQKSEVWFSLGCSTLCLTYHTHHAITTPTPIHLVENHFNPDSPSRESLQPRFI